MTPALGDDWAVGPDGLRQRRAARVIVLDEMRWLTTAELRAETREVFPTSLPDVVDALARGWDGTVRHLGVQHDDEPSDPEELGTPAP